MNRMIERLAPQATQLVRDDHTQVLRTFHRYRATTSRRVRGGLARSLCLALEVHTRLEEEVLYPAVREVSASGFLREAVPQHQSMRRRIAQLRDLAPDDPAFDPILLALMREVMHHMAEEETVFLPEAERVLRGRLGELGALMVRRRLALMAPRAPALALHRVQAMPARSLLVAAGIVVGGAWWGRHRARQGGLTA